MFTQETKTATVTNAVSNGSTIVYTATNTFVAGDIIHISGITPSVFNIPDAVITSRTSSNFTIASTKTGTYTSDGIAVYDEVKNHTISESTIRTQSLVLAEWNLNLASNTAKIGNYRYRPNNSLSPFYTIKTTYDSADTAKDYTDATYADIFIDGGYEDDETPYIIKTQNEQQRLLMSLENCIGKNRPRSGINKLMYFEKIRNIPSSNEHMAERPRYYVASKDDQFKYWSSFRTEVLDGTITAVAISTPSVGSVRYTANNTFAVGDTVYINNLAPAEYNGTFIITAATSSTFTVANSSVSTRTNQNGIAIIKDVPRGISKKSGANYYIEDAAPFVVYTEAVPANRVVVKMQTHIGTYDMGNSDQLYGDYNKQVPLEWIIQKLDSTNTWQNLASFTSSSTRSDSTPIIKEDGYVELEYGLVIPTGYETTFYYAGDYATASSLPAASNAGYAYLVGASASTPGQWYIYNGSTYDSPVTASYSWRIHEETVNRFTPFAKDLTSPSTYGSGVYREIDYIKGLRIVVSKMTKADIPFELIEMSPRLAVDLSDKTTGFSIKKHASDLGNSGMPVGQLLAGTGSLDLFDYDQAFNPNNTDSIINNFIAKNLQVKMYEIVVNVNGYDYYYPIKTMNCDGFPDYSSSDRAVTLTLRDQFTMFESMTAPQVFVRDVSLSWAMSTIFDSIGFSNYVFKRVDGTHDPIIPYFFIAPQTSVAQVLQDLAVSTQHMMFFDEYNNLIIMSKEYAMPTQDERSTDFAIYGSQDYTTSSTGLNNSIKFKNAKLSNILGISSKISDIYNDGKINYSARSIQKSITELKQAYNVDNYRTYKYKPVLLWEAPAEQNTKSVNQINNQSSGYALTAIPLNSTLSGSIPELQLATTGMVATLVAGIRTVTLTTGSTTNLVIGQVITKTSGSGVFGTGVKISEIISSSEFKVNADHATNGSTTFTAETTVTNNILDLGEGVYWMPRYNGYFYANGEIIKYDAVEYTIENIGDAWITSIQDYSNYFSKLGFAKKIYPTGRVRIYSKVDETGTSIAQHGRGQFGTEIVEHSAGLADAWKDSTKRKGFVMQADYLFDNKTIIATTTGAAGITANATNLATKSAKIEETIKNVLVSVTGESSGDGIRAPTREERGGSVQSSALVFSGPAPRNLNIKKINPRNMITYIPKQLDENYSHFGTRLRILGSPTQNVGKKETPTTQIVDNSFELYSRDAGLKGGSAGLSFMLDKTTNNGYYFEIAALTYDGTERFKAFNNVFFYKVKKDSSSSNAIPVPLYSGQATILVDQGEFVGQSRAMAEEYPTVYDLAVEYENRGSKWKRFYLYINNVLIAVVDDKDALPVKKNMALFTRGSTRVMFENIYAIRGRYERNPNKTISAPPAQSRTIFDDDSISSNEGLRKYAVSGMISRTFLSTVGGYGSEHNLYFDEFGTIMREAAYFDIKYDKAYPALTAKMSPTISSFKGYSVSGFIPTAYGAEFMVFNCTDNILMIGADNGNYLRIQGVTLTDEVSSTLTVDDYYNKKADFSNPTFSGTKLETIDLYKQYVDIKNSRTTYGVKQFDINAKYIQDQDVANELMGWLISKISKPRKAVGIEVFGIPYAQLGDIVTVDYVDEDNVNQISLTSDSRYVVYSSEYSYSENGPKQIIYLSEVQ